MSYGDNQYGGGASNSYYNSNEDFSSRNNNNSYGGSGGYGNNSSHHHSNDDNDFSGAAMHAQENDSNEDTSLFSSALNFLKDRKNDDNDVDEEKAANAHQAVYDSGSSDQKHDSNTLGAGAAMQALKMFTGGNENSDSSGGGMDKNKLIGLAMAQAGKLWDEKNGSGGNVVCSSCSCSFGLG